MEDFGIEWGIDKCCVSPVGERYELVGAGRAEYDKDDGKGFVVFDRNFHYDVGVDEEMLRSLLPEGTKVEIRVGEGR